MNYEYSIKNSFNLQSLIKKGDIPYLWAPLPPNPLTVWTQHWCLSTEVARSSWMYFQSFIRKLADSWIAMLSARLLTQTTRRTLIKICEIKKKGLLLAENLRSACCSPGVLSKVLATRERNVMTACARKKKYNACKDRSIPLIYKIQRSYIHSVDLLSRP